MPGDAPECPDERERFAVSRRDWLHRVAGVGMGVGLAAAARHRKLVPFLTPPEDLVPGVSTWYATSCRECPAGCGMIVRNREGRAVKCEGNPDHPINRGRLCARGQAALQGLYDPDRLRGPLSQGKPATWDAALQTIGQALSPLRGTGRVAVISDLQSGSLAALIRRWLQLFGSDRYLVYEPLSYDGIREANQFLCGQPVIPVPSLDRADFIISFGADFLETWVSPVQLTRQFAGNRSARFVYVGPRVSLTAANAHERILVRPGDEQFVALAMLQVLSEDGLLARDVTSAVSQLDYYAPGAVAAAVGVEADMVRRLAREFAKADAPLALAGDPVDDDPGSTHAVAVANLLNTAAGSPAFDLSAAHALTQVASRREVSRFLGDLALGRVEVLLVISADPAFSLGEEFAGPIQSVQHLICLTPFPDETSALASWVLPTHTPLESWGDYEPQTGVRNAMQPVMGALHDTRSAGDVLLALAEAADFDPQREFGAASFREYLFARWAENGPVEEVLQRGGRWTVPPARRPTLTLSRALDFGELPGAASRSLYLYPLPYLFDGRGANRRWLQELPDPITKVAWSSWVEVPPQDARETGLATGDTAKVGYFEAPTFSAPVYVYPGLAPGTVAVPLGQGHSNYGRYAEGCGTNAWELRRPVGSGRTAVALQKASVLAALPCADGSPHQHGRGIVRVVRASEEGRIERDKLRLPLPEGYTREGDMVPPHQHRDHRWAMAVDLNRCTGCSACVTACYAENNVGVVGAERFAEHRAMAWIRIDRYYDWSDPAAPILFLPLMCQQCDAAPCETVCPVFAAAHSEEGLNMQVYNRCVGTRYCSNNCPYKVRRFNWFDWQWPEPLNWQANPDVTVRSRGVMEKCTFCIQRIREAEVRAKRENRALVDGEVTPACAQTCPAEALVFGDLLDANSRISRLVAQEQRAYQVLGELNTKPAVFYLKRVVSDDLSS